MRSTLALVLVWVLIPLPLEAEGLSGTLSLTRHHHFQGLRQNGDAASLHGTLQYDVAGAHAGIWLGRYDLPGGYRSSTEIDYFIGVGKSVGFRHRFETSLWYYSYTDDALSDYDWSQWLTRYHYDAWLTLTVGVADNLLSADRPALLMEALAQRPLASNVSFSLAIGRNRFSEHIVDSFTYATAKAAYATGPWHLSLDYTASSSDDYFTNRWVHEGLSMTLTHTFD